MLNGARSRMEVEVERLVCEGKGEVGGPLVVVIDNFSNSLI